MNYLIGAIIFAAGYLTAYFTLRTKAKQPVSQTETIQVKRVRPNLRNPLATYKSEQQPYERNKKGLYEPRKPKADKRDEVTV